MSLEEEGLRYEKVGNLVVFDGEPGMRRILRRVVLVLCLLPPGKARNGSDGRDSMRLTRNSCIPGVGLKLFFRGRGVSSRIEDYKRLRMKWITQANSGP